MDNKLEEIEFVIFDTETTGLDFARGDRIAEIAGIRFKGKEKIAVFHSLVNPQRPVSSGAFAVNQITAEMLKDAPKMDDVLPGFLEFIQGSCLASYNASFDLGFLNQAIKSAGKVSLPEDIAVVDILLMAKRLLPGLNRYALWFVADKLGVRVEQKHRALSDVELTWEVFNRLKEILAQKGAAINFNDFLNLFGINPAAQADSNNQKIIRIQEAIDLGFNLRIKYLSGSGLEVSLRDVAPKEIKRDKSRQYLVAHCCLRNEERTFKVSNILELEVMPHEKK
ncbi:MAG: exonuclease domain-containing protein [Candidatus Omnitrophota bacterium]|nr:WYL domain-containing protein [Candidatus Omnitrophota bacterium]MBU1928291.1 WYL domain-containing protein [Candidatus Omnitrophota bacterium]MBU2035553.1 WYL domain-containing protein [Candidatus Omnitrophota bacterium]MBU2221749.1 WYL domain-containing protein [Candidatus Omnitrophota bacterium]